MKNNTENDFRAIFTSFLKLQNYVFSSKVSLCKILWITEKGANSWDFFRLNFSPTIYPPIICLKRLFSATCQKKEIPDNAWLSGICLIFLLFSVIRLGLEPRTPTLKVLCSTYWASESSLLSEWGCKDREISVLCKKRISVFYVFSLKSVRNNPCQFPTKEI